MSFTIEQWIAEDQCWREIHQVPVMDIEPMIAVAKMLSWYVHSGKVRVIDREMGQAHALFENGLRLDVAPHKSHA
jgi:hypothetical protein